ncbi:N-acetylmuramoyl-L-alanine amidase [Streptomyces asoensis]|uniref:N-acetylmuramoyl-L-alanine amidase n=1 Tax=Streptomyces asoensis TaxID=249586 RepID=A0A6M4WUY8_9ACTN|nr:peptidoglycan-binding protein [Streptomyces asoensis]QJT04344.1 N-acetylmuramoyl-L-alanine amidase [Streptomyces asoensis]
MTTRTGPQTYPGASQAHRYQGKFGGDDMEVNVVVLHTTEGRTLPDYGGGASAPTLTCVPDFAARRLKWWQHFDIDTSARALLNLAGGVETNTNNVCQLEMVGTCDPATRAKWLKAGLVQDKDFIYWPQAPDWALRDVAEFLAWMHTKHSVPLSGPSKWPAYPTSYANGGGQRMNDAAWNAFRGVCGHMHVDENSHGDPGALDFAKLLAFAKEAAGAPSTPVVEAKYEPFPGAAWFRKNPRSAIVTALGKRLVAVGCSAYEDGPGPQWTEADRKSYARWQRKLGYTGAAADGWPGATSWAALKVPNV